MVPSPVNVVALTSLFLYGPNQYALMALREFWRVSDADVEILRELLQLMPRDDLIRLEPQVLALLRIERPIPANAGVATSPGAVATCFSPSGEQRGLVVQSSAFLLDALPVTGNCLALGGGRWASSVGSSRDDP